MAGNSITGIDLNPASYVDKVRASVVVRERKSDSRLLCTVAPEVQAELAKALNSALTMIAKEFINTAKKTIDINGEQFKITREYSKGEITGATQQTTITLTRGKSEIKIVFQGEDAAGRAATLKQLSAPKPEPIDEATVAARLIRIRISDGTQSVTYYPRTKEMVFVKGAAANNLVLSQETGRLTGEQLALQQFKAVQE